ncbi:unnamed protein product [Prorocentrum cordatum]|uniref:Uncharacterized protein n=1 Tax=Prorocentrum cordatum TaxID=2364126 RepID=A0ABN9TKR3_9DINO|nr:unnamed protein product [Polarella glacialis]
MTAERAAGGGDAARPKKAAKGKGSSKGSGNGGTGSTTVGTTISNHASASLLQTVQDSLSVIKAHPTFLDIDKLNPLKIEEGGSQTPFKQADCEMVLKVEGDGVTSYRCGGNFFWQNTCWFPNPKTPVNHGQVKEKQKSLVPDEPPCRLDFATVIALDSRDVPAMSHRGALQRLSPREPALALLFSIHEAIAKKVDDNTLLKWRKLVLSAPFEFEVVKEGNDDRFWRARNVRQNCTQNGLVVRLSTRQWIFDAIGFKEGEEKVVSKSPSAIQVAKLYQDRMDYAKNTEKVTMQR